MAGHRLVCANRDRLVAMLAAKVLHLLPAPGAPLLSFDGRAQQQLARRVAPLQDARRPLVLPRAPRPQRARLGADKELDLLRVRVRVRVRVRDRVRVKVRARSRVRS